MGEAIQEFEAIGVNVVAMTYDAPATNHKFVKRKKLPFPLLSDADARHALAFGILNESYAPGHRAYGVPHPGIFLVDAKGVIRAKFAEGVRVRPQVGDLIEAARQLTETEPVR